MYKHMYKLWYIYHLALRNIILTLIVSLRRCSPWWSLVWPGNCLPSSLSTSALFSMVEISTNIFNNIPSFYPTGYSFGFSAVAIPDINKEMRWEYESERDLLSKPHYSGTMPVSPFYPKYWPLTRSSPGLVRKEKTSWRSNFIKSW